jgi:hypothetical protein
MRNLLIVLALLATGCAPTTFELKPQGADTTIPVGTKAPAEFAAPPLQYRMLSDGGHLVLWIDNHTETEVYMFGAKSTAKDSDGNLHALRYHQIEPHSSVKLIFPPLSGQNPDESIDQPPPYIPQPGSAYDNPGFLNIPNSGAGQPPANTWRWDDNSEIHLNLQFQQGDHKFEQRFDILKVRK